MDEPRTPHRLNHNTTKIVPAISCSGATAGADVGDGEEQHRRRAAAGGGGQDEGGDRAYGLELHTGYSDAERRARGVQVAGSGVLESPESEDADVRGAGVVR